MTIRCAMARLKPCPFKADSNCAATFWDDHGGCSAFDRHSESYVYNDPPLIPERNRMRRCAAVLLIVLLTLPSFAADETPLADYSPRSSQAERDWEMKFRAL